MTTTGKRRVHRDALQRPEQIIPAPGAHEHGEKVDGHTRDQPQVVAVLQVFSDLLEIKPLQRPQQENGADRNAQPELPTFHT